MIHQHGDHGGNIAAAAARFNRHPDQFIDFSSNVNPLGLPPGLTAVLQNALREITRYPVPYAAPFRRLLARTLKLPEEHLLVGNGASDLIHLLFLHLQPRRLLLPAPTFGEYEQAAWLTGSAVQYWPLPPGTRPDLNSLKRSLQKADLAVFCNPNNPTGAYLPRSFMEELLDTAFNSGTRVMVDESFFPFTGRPPSESLVSLVPTHPNLWVLTSLTKLWALPGLRLGYLAGPAIEIKALTDHGDPWRVNSLAQAAGMYCLKQTDFTAKTVELVARERRYLERHLAQLPELKIFSGKANFLLAEINTPDADSQDLYRYLGNRGLLIRDASNFRGLDQRYFRIAVRRRHENRRLISELQAYFKERSKKSWYRPKP